MIFRDRKEAGEKLADELKEKVSGKGLVLGIPRGGVVVAKIVAERLGWDLDVLVTKKIGANENPELAVGAAVEDESGKVKEYIQKFRDGKKLMVKGKTVMVVDDGIATGWTMKAGVEWLREQGARKIIVAVPVCAKDTAKKLKKLTNEWICLDEVERFYAVGQFYRSFPQVEDEEVRRLLVE